MRIGVRVVSHEVAIGERFEIVGAVDGIANNGREPLVVDDVLILGDQDSTRLLIQTLVAPRRMHSLQRTCHSLRLKTIKTKVEIFGMK